MAGERDGEEIGWWVMERERERERDWRRKMDSRERQVERKVYINKFGGREIDADI